MTPLRLEMMLWYATRDSAFPVEAGDERNRYIVDDSHFWLHEHGLLAPVAPRPCTPAYMITPKGRFFVEYLTKIPVPTERFEILPHDIERHAQANGGRFVLNG